MQFKKVSHVIFDMDGLILESESAYERILNSIAKLYGKEYTHDVKLKILGTPELDTAKIFLSELDIPLSVEQFIEEYHKRIAEELQNPAFMPGVEKLIKHFADHNIPIAVATSSSKQSYDIKTKNHEAIFKLFHHIVCGTSDPEVKRGKPAPDIFLVCCSRFPDKPDPSQVLVLEDAPNGVRGALAAGMQGVLVPAPDVNDELRKPATLVINSLEEFKPEWFGLPAYLTAKV